MWIHAISNASTDIARNSKINLLQSKLFVSKDRRNVGWIMEGKVRTFYCGIRVVKEQVGSTFHLLLELQTFKILKE